jgi:quercetin 2,3-dioxygenase
MCDPYEGHIFPLEPAPFRFDRVIQHLADLDLKLLERPGGDGV